MYKIFITINYAGKVTAEKRKVETNIVPTRLTSDKMFFLKSGFCPAVDYYELMTSCDVVHYVCTLKSATLNMNS